MCVAPIRLKDGTFVGCRNCPRCQDNRLNDLIGRCLAEQSTSTATFSVTLTYKGDGPESAVLRYADIQRLLKRLRKDGYAVRYICAGEYGSAKGRAHWHIVLFFRGKVPAVEFGARIQWSYWSDFDNGGFCYFQQPDWKGFRYAMKYALKDQTGGSRQLSMSKKPPLGHDFFVGIARESAERSMSVLDPEYSFSNVLARDGSPRRFWLQGRMREIYLDTYLAHYEAVNGRTPWVSDWITERYLHPIARKEKALDAEDLRAVLEAKRPRFVNLEAPPSEYVDPGKGDGVLMLPGGAVWCYSTHVGGGFPFAVIDIGGHEWRVVLQDRSAALVREQLSPIPIPATVRAQVYRWLLRRWQITAPQRVSSGAASMTT